MNEEKYVEMLENGELYDYITNLQQENERLKEMWGDTRTFIKDNKRLMMNKNGYDVYEDYKSRCEKAIEYLKYQLNDLDFYDDIKAKILCSMAIVILEGKSDE